jgi:hypothetical protein
LEGRKAPSRAPGIPGLRPSLLALLLLPAALAVAAPGRSPLDCDVLLGFNGSVRPGRFSPLVVTVGNRGPQADVRVEAEVSRPVGMGGTAAWRTLVRTVTVPRSGSARVRFALPVPESPRTLTVRVFPDDPVKTGARQREGAAPLAAIEIDLRDAAVAGGLVAVVSSELAFDRLSLRPGQEGPTRIAYPHPENLPESWAAYDCVDAVIVRDTASQRLRPAQAGALREWVYAGGTLVFTGGAPALLLASSGFGDLVPVEVTGLGAAAGLGPLAAALGVPRAPPGTVGLAVSRVLAGGEASGKVLAVESGVPLVVSRRLGRGALWFIAFDCAQPSIASWEGLDRLWDMAIGSGRPAILETAGPGLAEDRWMKPLLAAPGLAFPSTLAVLAFAVLYVAAFALLAAAKPFGKLRPGTRAALLVLVTILAAGAGFAVFNRVVFDPRRLVADAARVDSTAGDGLALVTEKVGLLPAEGPRVEVLAAGGATVVSAPASLALTSREQPLRGAGAAAGHWTSVAVEAGERFAGALLTLADVIEFPVRASLSPGPAGPSLIVSNGSGWGLEGSFLLLGGRAWDVGTIPAGSRVSLPLDPAGGQPFTAAGGRAWPPGDTLSRELLQQAFPAADREGTALVGWLSRSPLGVRRPGAPPPGGLFDRRDQARALVVLRMQ